MKICNCFVRFPCFLLLQKEKKTKTTKKKKETSVIY